MTLLMELYRHTLGRLMPSPRGSRFDEQRSKKRKRDNEAEDEDKVNKSKRDTSTGSEEVITKRRRVAEDRFAPIVDGEVFESTDISAPSGLERTSGFLDSVNRKFDQKLMPPPALSPIKSKASTNIWQGHSRRATLDADNASQLSVVAKATHQRPSDSFVNEYDMERARRHALATTLPANSGVWERAEQDLFFHLSYRGFEPLLPKDWMTDFRTMPISLFPSEGEDAPAPLLQVCKPEGNFRAIKELRDLLELGKIVRDKVLSSSKARPDAIIEKAVKKYINWALNDVGIKSSSTATSRASLPIHVVVKLKSKQTTTDCLLELKNRLHTLRAQHYEARNIHESIERDASSYETPESEDETRLADDSEEDVPVLYGIMVCRSILAIFTLNNRTPSPRFSQHTARGIYYSSPPPTDGFGGDTIVLRPSLMESVNGTDVALSVASTEDYPQVRRSLMTMEDEDIAMEDDSASDPRFISDFDFSDQTKDVWNALVVVILAMQIRNDMLLFEQNSSVKDPLEDLRAGIEDSMDIDEDDPDV